MSVSRAIFYILFIIGIIGAIAAFFVVRKNVGPGPACPPCPSPSKEEKIVSIAFDDGLGSTYWRGKPALDRYGLRGTIYVVTGSIDKVFLDPELDARSEAITLQQLKELYEAGWEIGSHSVTHPHFASLTEDEIYIELHNSKNDLEYAGFEVPGFAFPYRETGFIAGPLALRHYDYVRDYLDARVYMPTHNDTVHQVLEEIDNYDGWVILVFHEITPDWDSNLWSWQINKLSGLVDDLFERGVTVLPVGEVVRREEQE